jgi:hypothetical protein
MDFLDKWINTRESLFIKTGSEKHFFQSNGEQEWRVDNKFHLCSLQKNVQCMQLLPPSGDYKLRYVKSHT